MKIDRTPMKVEFAIFVLPGVSEAQVRQFIDEAIHHHRDSVLGSQIGDYVFLPPVVTIIKREEP